ncbi:hypothetical protein RUM43_008154, partial [Polyplax serrata]
GNVRAIKVLIHSALTPGSFLTDEVAPQVDTSDKETNFRSRHGLNCPSSYSLSSSSQ